MREKPNVAMPPARMIDTVRVGGIDVARLSTQEWIDLLLYDHERNRHESMRPRYHTAVNGNVLSVCARRQDVRNAITGADAIAADGMPILVAAKYLLNKPIADRAATTDLFHDIAAAAQDHGLSMYFLGATASQNAAAVAKVQALYPQLKIVGRHDGYFSPAEEDAVIADIQAAAPDILWVALGMPREDLFVVRNLDRLSGVTWVKTCGGLFNFLSGKNKRAPKWMRNYALEWLYRLWLEPRRLGWRYFTTNFHAIWLILTRR